MLTTGADYNPSQGAAWSRDGAKLAFASTGFGNLEIHVIDADGTNEARVTKNPHRDQMPEWSRDGTRLVFSRDSARIYTIAIDGSDEQLVRDNAYDPAWRW